jgi:hypothetical protein
MKGTDIVINVFFFENRSLYEIMWKNMVALDSTQAAM